MTLTELARFISKNSRGEIFQVERDGQGGASVYFFSKDKTTGKTRHFAIHCAEAEQIRVNLSHSAPAADLNVVRGALKRFGAHKFIRVFNEDGIGLARRCYCY